MKRESLHLKQIESQHLESMSIENRSLCSKISQLKDKIYQKKNSNITLEDSSALAENLKKLEESQFDSLQKNIELKKQLSEMRQTNFEKKCDIVSPRSRDNLIGIYCDILRMGALGKNIIAKERVKLEEITQIPYNSLNITPAQVVSLIKKEISDMRVLISDVYAEQCCDVCHSF